METYEELRDTSKKKILIADHILTQSYPLVRDPKLLLAVVENIFLSLTHSMSALLEYERKFKRVPPFTNNFESKFHILNTHLVPKHNINKEHMTLIRDIKDIIIEHKRSPIEFSRKDRFIICSDDYSIKSITLEEIKKYIETTKNFIVEVNNIINRDQTVEKNRSMF